MLFEHNDTCKGLWTVKTSSTINKLTKCAYYNRRQFGDTGQLSRKTSPHSFRRNLAAGFQDLQCPLSPPFTGIDGMPVLGPVHLSVVVVILRCKIECARINGPCP